MMADATPPTAGERRLALLLRFLALLFVAGTAAFLLRPEEIVHGLGAPAAMIGLPALATSTVAVESDFWFALAVANMATNAACCWIAAGDVRARRALVYPVVVSMLVATSTAALVFIRWAPALPFLVIVIVALPVALVLLRALGRARTA